MSIAHLRLRHPAPRRPAPHHRHGHLHRRLRAAGHGARGHAPQPARARAHQADRRRGRAEGAGRPRRLHRPGRQTPALKADPVRVAAAEREPQDRASTQPICTQTSSATSATSSPSSSPTPTYQAYDALDLIEVDYEPLPSVTDPREGRCGRARRSCTRTCPDNVGVPLDRRGRRRRRGVRERRGRRQGADRPAAAHPERDGAAAALAQWSGASGELTLWNTTQNPHILRFLSSRRHRRARGQAARHRAGGRRRLRQQDRRYPADFVTIFCAMQLGRPVKWTETRSENYQATTTAATTCRKSSWPRRRTGRSWACAPRRGPAWARISRRRRQASRRSCTA